MGLNAVIFQGNLAADPVVHGENKDVARFTLANNTGFGENANANFIDCVAFGKQVETIMKYLKKGKEIVIKGRLIQNRWKTPEGENRSRLEVHLDNYDGFSFTSGGARQEDEGEPEPAVAVATAGGEKKKLF